MCLTCGCHSPSDSHGDSTNITLAILAAAADAVGISVVQAARNVRDTLPVPGPLPRPHCDIDGVFAIQPEASINAVNAAMGARYLVPEVTAHRHPPRRGTSRPRWPSHRLSLQLEVVSQQSEHAGQISVLAWHAGRAISRSG